MRIFYISLSLWLGLLVASCQPTAVDADVPLEITPSPIVETVPPISGEPQMTPSLSADVSLQALIETIRTDLANKQAIPLDEIIVVETMEVEWSDSSLGCPEPGMEYLQVITPGYRIVLQANNQSYEYHTNREAYFVYCPDPIPPIIPKP